MSPGPVMANTVNDPGLSLGRISTTWGHRQTERQTDRQTEANSEKHRQKDKRARQRHKRATRRMKTQRDRERIEKAREVELQVKRRTRRAHAQRASKQPNRSSNARCRWIGTVSRNRNGCLTSPHDEPDAQPSNLKRRNPIVRLCTFPTSACLSNQTVPHLPKAAEEGVLGRRQVTLEP